jgi:hypothetical protein
MHRNSSPDRAFRGNDPNRKSIKAVRRWWYCENAPATSAQPVRGRSRSRQSGDRLLHAQTRSMRQNVYSPGNRSSTWRLGSLHTLRASARSQHDPARPEDVNTESEDHAGDEWRYACMSRPFVRVPVARTRTVPDVGYAARGSAAPGIGSSTDGRGRLRRSPRDSWPSPYRGRRGYGPEHPTLDELTRGSISESLVRVNASRTRHWVWD